MAIRRDRGYVRESNGSWKAANPNAGLTQYQEYFIKYLNDLDKLFNLAKAKNEFDFIWALLRLRKLTPTAFDTVDTLKEVSFANEVIARKYGAWRAVSPHYSFFRYGLVVESDEIYSLIYNLLRAANGEGYQPTPFPSFKKNGRSYPLNPLDKIAKIKSKARAVSLRFDSYDDFYDNKLRNAFFHSNYVLYFGNVYVVGENEATYDQARILTMTNAASAFCDATIKLVEVHRNEYLTTKEIAGTNNFAGTTAHVIVKEGVGLTGLIQKDEIEINKYRTGIFTPSDTEHIKAGQYELPSNPNIRAQEVIYKFPRRLQKYVARFYKWRLG